MSTQILETREITVHGYRLEGDNQVMIMRGDGEPDGYSAFERTAPDEGGMFDVPWDVDAPTFDEAWALAEARAKEIDFPVNMIEEL